MTRAWVTSALCIACGDSDLGSVESRSAALSAEPVNVSVSLTFDDTWKSQVDAAAVLDAHALSGTFYLNSPLLHRGQAQPELGRYMSVSDARALQEHGHEIGAHTLSHLVLTSLDDSEQEREVANDRLQLSRLGLSVRSLAYPRGDMEADAAPGDDEPLPEIVRKAGYTSARDTNGLRLGSCAPAAESVPPADHFRLRSVRSISHVPPIVGGGPQPPPDTADTLLGWIDHVAECGGGWLPLIFHHVRDRCSGPDAPAAYCFELEELERLAAALASGERCRERAEGDRACYRIRVAPISAVLGDAELLPAYEAFAARNASLERTLASGRTECMQFAQGSAGTAVFSRSTLLAHSGQASEGMHIAPPYVAPAELRVTRDFGACAIFATEGAQYELSLLYRTAPEAPAPTLRFVVHRLTREYAWQTWVTGPAFAAVAPGSWVRQPFTTPPAAADTVALSFGLRLESAGTVHVDDFEVSRGDRILGSD